MADRRRDAAMLARLTDKMSSSDRIANRTSRGTPFRVSLFLYSLIVHEVFGNAAFPIVVILASRSRPTCIFDASAFVLAILLTIQASVEFMLWYGIFISTKLTFLKGYRLAPFTILGRFNMFREFMDTANSHLLLLQCGIWLATRFATTTNRNRVERGNSLKLNSLIVLVFTMQFLVD